MQHVVLVAPYFGKMMVECLQAFAKLPNTKLGIVSNQPQEAIPKALRSAIAAHYRIDNCLNPLDLVRGVGVFQQEWGKVDRLIGYLEHLQTPLAEARTALGIQGMQQHVAGNFRDKNQMKDVLRRSGLPVARQAKIHGLEDLLAFTKQVGYPIILKPLAGVGSKNTMRVRDESELYSALNRLLPAPDRPVQAEEFVQGEEYTLESVTINGKVVWQSSTYYLPGPLKVLENPWMQYCVLLPREINPPHVKTFAQVNEAALKSLGMATGLSHMEWFQRPNGAPVISEVGARPPGVNIMGMMAAAHNVNMWDKWARLMVFDEWDMPPRSYAAGSAFLRGKGRGTTIRQITGLDQVLADLKEQIVAAKLPRVGQQRSSHYEGEGWVIVRHPETDGVVKALRKLVTETHIEFGESK